HRRSRRSSQGMGVPGLMRLRNAVVLAIAPAALLTPALSDCAPSPSPCTTIYNEMRRQGASSGVASNFAYHIAPRESGCTAPIVHRGDDSRYSCVRLERTTSGLRA